MAPDTSPSLTLPAHRIHSALKQVGEPLGVFLCSHPFYSLERNGSQKAAPGELDSHSGATELPGGHAGGTMGLPIEAWSFGELADRPGCPTAGCPKYGFALSRHKRALWQHLQAPPPAATPSYSSPASATPCYSSPASRCHALLF